MNSIKWSPTITWTMNSTILERAFFPSTKYQVYVKSGESSYAAKSFSTSSSFSFSSSTSSSFSSSFISPWFVAQVATRMDVRRYVRTYRFAFAKECWKTMGFSSLDGKFCLSHSLSLPRSYYIKENFYEFLIKFLFN